MVILSSATSQPVKKYKYLFDGDLHRNSVLASDRSLTIEYSIPELYVDNLISDEGTFYRVTIPGHTPSTEIGKPELPVMVRLIKVPEGCSWQVRITGVKSVSIKPSNKRIKGILFPAQEGETKEVQKQKPKFTIDKSVYSSHEFLKSDTVKIEPVGKLRNVDLANLLIFPARYNPQSNVIEVITSMKIEILFSGTGNSSSKTLIPQVSSFSNTLDKSLLNFNPEDVINGFTDKPVRMIILTDTAFKKQLRPFLEWKTQKGFKLEVIYKGASFAGDNYTAIKSTLTTIYNSSSAENPPPEYLLIIGDVSRIPFYGTGNITDMYYGEFDGNGDYIPEMFIGRLPVSDTTELRSVINKIIQYEKFTFDSNNKFYSNGLITAGYDGGYADLMNGQVKYVVTNYLTPANKINDYHFYYPGSYTAKDSIIKLINRGTSIINYTGHGESAGWLHINSPNYASTGIKTGDIQYMTNKDMYPFVISNACQTSRFNTNSFGNKMVVAAGKGAIGFIGCSNDSYWNEDFYWSVGTGTPSADPTYETTGLGAFDRLFHTHNESPSEWYYTMGQINYAGNLAVSSSTSSRKKYYWETYNLVGDPSVIPITGPPDSFNIALPDTLPDNTESYSFIADPFSYVAVSHFDTLWDASFVSPSGSVTLDMKRVSDDSCLFVITGQDKVPLIKTVHFSNLSTEFINLSKTALNDAPGNNNGLADFGETFFLDLTISNLGSADANNLVAILSTTSEWVNINTDSLVIGDLHHGSSIRSNNVLSVTLAKNIPDKGLITFDLLLKDSKVGKNYKIDIPVHAPKLEILSYIMDDSETGNGNFIADQGELVSFIFKIQNEGSSNTSGLLKLSSSDADITVLEPSKNSGTLLSNNITEIPVLVKLSDYVKSGAVVSLSTVLDCDPFLISKNFSFRVGRIRETFEAASFRIFPWINVSSIPWVISASGSYEGTLAAKSGLISNNTTTSLGIKTIYPDADSVKFYYKVSSETNYDFFIFKVNDIEILRKSGEIPWQQAVIQVPAGYNKLEWLYKKDQSVSQGSDCAMIDMIDFAGPGSVRYITKDIVTAKIESPFNKENLEKELVSIKVLNVGPDTVKGFNLAYSINNGPPVSQHFTESLIPFGDSVTVTFNTKADLSHFGDYQLVAYNYNNNDDYLLNDTLSKSIRNEKLDGPLLVYPNPFYEELTLIINSQFDAPAHITLFNTTGSKVLDFTQMISEGINKVYIKNRLLVPSVYFLKVEFPGASKTIRVVKVK